MRVAIPRTHLPGLHWYHTHPHGESHRQVLDGMSAALIIEGILYEIYGPNPKQLNASYVQSSVHVFGFYLSYIYVYGFALALVLVAAIYALLYRTGFGRSVRATMQDETASPRSPSASASR